jgi:membrane-bound ClpP family serine protease
MNQVKQKAQGFGESAGTFAEKVTQAAAIAAGTVVGAVQAALPEPSQSRGSSSSS